MTSVVPTAEFASLVYGAGRASMDDPAETFHEASRLYPNVAPGRLETLLLLARSPALQQTVARSSRTQDHRPGIDLARGVLPSASFRAVLAMRRSRSATARHRLRLRDLGAVLEASYAASPVGGSTLRRPVPSGGALYPLEVYVLALRLAGVDRSALHYNPFLHRLEVLGPLEPRDLRAALVDPSLVDGAAALLVLTAMFWRSRFKVDRPQLHNTACAENRAMEEGVLVVAPEASSLDMIG
jgi:hypothetical protein